VTRTQVVDVLDDGLWFADRLSSVKSSLVSSDSSSLTRQHHHIQSVTAQQFLIVHAVVTGNSKFDPGLARLLHLELHRLNVSNTLMFIMMFSCVHGQAPRNSIYDSTLIVLFGFLCGWYISLELTVSPDHIRSRLIH